MQNSVCTGDCYRATNYNELITTAVVKIVRENCEALISVKPGDICSSRSTTLIAEGVGFGGKEPAPGNLRFMIGNELFEGTWQSDSRATVDIAAWENQFGNAYTWDPAKDPFKTVTLRVRVSIDGGNSFLREKTNNPNGYTITFKACSRINSCAPVSDGSCYDCHEGLNVLTVKGTNMGIGPNNDEENPDMVCGFGVYAVPATWVDRNTAKCIVPPMNCTFQSEFCDASHKPPNPDWKGIPPTVDSPHHRIDVPFNFSLDGGVNWFPLNESMQTFHYEPCLPDCDYDNSIPPIPLILLLLSLLLCCLPPMALLIGDKEPIKMPELRSMPEPDPPPPLVFGTELITVVKKTKRVTETKPTEKKKKQISKPKKEKKKWDVVAAGQYLRGGKHMAVGWGKYGEAEHGEEFLDGFEEEDSSEEDEDIDWEMEAEKQLELAFDEHEEQVRIPQAPEDVEMPRIAPVAGIAIEVEDELTCSQKFEEFLKDWRWKWWLTLFLVLVLMAISVWLLVSEHKRLEDDINSRTYGLSDPECKRSSRLAPANSTKPQFLWTRPVRI
jgi:predicted nucleic acid-binding Zn ribbon protein